MNDKLTWEKDFVPKTEIARLCWEIRKRYIENGGKLYTADEINKEIRELRGETDNDG